MKCGGRSRSQRADLEFFLHLAHLSSELVVDGHLTVDLLLLGRQLDAKLAHLGSALRDRHLYAAYSPLDRRSLSRDDKRKRVVGEF